jgi:sugar (pentulose or hexulose) kinase
MLAGIGAGVYSGPGEAVAAACHPAEPVLPDPAGTGRYDDAYRRYRAVLASDVARVPPPGPGG